MNDDDPMLITKGTMCERCNGVGYLPPPQEEITCSTCAGDGMANIAQHDAREGQPVEVSREQCPTCNGRGLVTESNLCPVCRGNGCSCSSGQYCGRCIPF